MRDRDFLSHLAQDLEMLGNSFAKSYRHFFDRGAGSNTSRDVRRVRGKICAGVFDDDGELGHRDLLSSPAGLTMLPSVPFGTSSPRPPATHTEPDLVSCLKRR